VLGAALVTASLVATSPSVEAMMGPTTSDVYTASTTPTGGDGSTEAQAIIYDVSIDCSKMPEVQTGWGDSEQDWNRMVVLTTSAVAPDLWYTIRVTITDAPADMPTLGSSDVGCGSVGASTVGLDPAVSVSNPFLDYSSATPTDPVVLTYTAFAAFEDEDVPSGSLRAQIIWDDWTSGTKESMGAFFIVNIQEVSDTGPGPGPGSGNCDLFPPFLTSYPSPVLLRAECTIVEAVDGTLVVGSEVSMMSVMLRFMLPAGTSGVRIDTGEGMRYRAFGPENAFPLPCGLITPSPPSGPMIPTQATSGPYTGVSTCEITLDTAAASELAVFIDGMLILSGDGPFPLTYTLLNGSTVVDTFEFTVARGAAPSTDTNTSTDTDSNTGSSTATSVAFATEQAAAAGIAGTSSGLLVLDGALVTVTSNLAADVGPRGGVVLEADGLKVTLSSASGASETAGVVVAADGEIACQLCAALVPGSTVEAWVNSDPRLAVELEVPADHGAEDCLDLDVSMAEPADGEGPIVEGPHTLQLHMTTDEGFAVLSTGITVGGVAPVSVPAGEGSPAVPLMMLAMSLLGGAALLTRRMVAAG
jgi:hypothetical protein